MEDIKITCHDGGCNTTTYCFNYDFVQDGNEMKEAHHLRGHVRGSGTGGLRSEEKEFIRTYGLIY